MGYNLQTINKMYIYHYYGDSVQALIARVWIVWYGGVKVAHTRQKEHCPILCSLNVKGYNAHHNTI